MRFVSSYRQRHLAQIYSGIGLMKRSSDESSLELEIWVWDFHAVTSTVPPVALNAFSLQVFASTSCLTNLRIQTSTVHGQQNGLDSAWVLPPRPYRRRQNGCFMNCPVVAVKGKVATNYPAEGEVYYNFLAGGETW